MSKSSKQSADVISKMTGKDKITEDFELSDNVKKSIEKVTGNVKRTKASEAASNTKKKLVERQVNRKSNELKSKLTEALYTEDETSLQEKEQLEMLFVLQELGKKNEEAQKVTNKVNNKKYQTQKELQQYETKDGNPDLSEKLKRLETRIHGPEVDVLDLINRK